MYSLNHTVQGISCDHFKNKFNVTKRFNEISFKRRSLERVGTSK